MARSAPTAARSAPRQALAALAADYWDARMRASPLRATLSLYPRYHDLLDDNSPAGRARAPAEFRGLRARLRGLEAARLSAGERLTRDVLDFKLAADLELSSHEFWKWSVDHIDGHHTLIAAVVDVAQPMRTREDVLALSARLAAVPVYFRQQIESLREGLSEGRVSARRPVANTIAYLKEALRVPGERTPFALVARRLPPGLRAGAAARLARAAERFVFPAYRDYLSFLERECLPRARPDARPGVAALPGGPEYYDCRIRRHTTLPASAAEIHRVGLDEVRAVHDEMRELAGRMGGSGRLARRGLRAFFAGMRKDPRNFFRSRAEILRVVSGLIAEAQARLPRFFGVFPETPVVVQAVQKFKESTAPGGQYYAPPDDLSRPGIFYVNAGEPRARARFSIASLTAHETVPGHHLQSALAVENRRLPLFRRRASFTAFVEGWALYSERLADEMGLYADERSRFGMLTDQAFRAVRLVVDTGLHAEGWSRRRAVEYMLESTPMPRAEIESEVDRYICWPGQALAYKMGQRELEALRRDSRAALGSKFDLRAFHDAVLSEGALPLPLLRRRILSFDDLPA